MNNMQEQIESNNSLSNVPTSNSYAESIPSSLVSNYTKVGTGEKPIISKDNIKIEIEDQKNNNPKITSVSSEHISEPLITEKSKSFYYKKIGNSHAFLGNKYGDPIIIVGPHWPVYFIIVFFITIFSAVVFRLFNQFISDSYKLIGRFLYSTFFTFYTFTTLINPGFPKNDLDALYGEPRSQFTFCESCEIWVKNNKKVKHCNFCDICIEGYDHHCIWVSKCVGEKNLYCFYAFIFCGLFIIAYFICLSLNVMKLNKQEEMNN